MKRKFYRAIPKKNISLCGRPVIGWKEAGAHADEKSSVYEEMKAYVENIFARLGIAGDIVATQTSDEIYYGSFDL